MGNGNLFKKSNFALVGVRSVVGMSLARRFGIEGCDLMLVVERIAQGTNLDSDRLAGEYWRLHCQEKADWERELVLR